MNAPAERDQAGAVATEAPARPAGPAAEAGRPARGRLLTWLFPDPPRDLPGRRVLKILLRAAHVLPAGILVGAYVLAAGPDQVSFWLHATVGSGILVLLLDLHESGVFVLQVRGLVVLIKALALAALPWLGAATPWVLGGLMMVSVLSSHAPGRVRYHLLVGEGRWRGASSKG